VTSWAETMCLWLAREDIANSLIRPADTKGRSLGPFGTADDGASNGYSSERLRPLLLSISWLDDEMTETTAGAIFASFRIKALSSLSS